jgi:hypothetical protein
MAAENGSRVSAGQVEAGLREMLSGGTLLARDRGAAVEVGAGDAGGERESEPPRSPRRHEAACAGLDACSRT